MDSQGDKAKSGGVTGQFIRFNAIGIVNTLVAYLVYAGLVFVGVHQTLAVLADYAAGLWLGFVLNRRFTFRVNHGRTMPMFGRLVLVYVPLAGTNIILLHLLVDNMGMNKYLAQLGLVFLLACVAFVLQKLFVFGDRGYRGNA
jgi:putative flippase GtrA